MNQETKHAPVERRHRLLVLEAYGYTEQWLLERKLHRATKWLEDGSAGAVDAQADKFAQLLADEGANARQDREAYQRGLRLIIDRIDRAIADELGQPLSVASPRLEPAMFAPGIQGAVNDVFAFHNATDVPCSDFPQWPGDDRAQLRWDLAVEELGELGEALGLDEGVLHMAIQGLRALKPDRLPDERVQVVRVADALADKIYIDIGTALEFGIPLQAVWAAVQRANMAKVGPDGKVSRREDGKILKPEGWQPPDVEKAVFGELGE